MAATLVQSAQSQTNASTTVSTYGSATTSGNVLVAFGLTNGSTSGLTISGWTKGIDTDYSGGAQSIGIFYKVSDGTETTVTLTGNTICRLHISEWSGITVPVVSDGTNTNAVNSVTSISTNSVTTTNASDIMFVAGGISTSGAGTRSWDSSFNTFLDDVSGPRLLSGYRVVSSTGTYSTTGTLHTSNTNSGAIIIALPLYDNQQLTVDGDGNTTSGWVAEGGTYTAVQSDDGVTTKLYSPTNGDVRQFSLTNTSGLSGKTIVFVRVYAKVATLAAYSGNFQIGVRTGSTDYWSADKTHSTTTYTLYSEAWTTNPNTGVAWTVSDLDALQIGVKKTDINGLRITYAYAEAYYTAGAASSVNSGFFGLM